MLFFSKPLKCGAKLRLQHLQTRMYIHSHNFRSPLSNNQEVSCFGNNGEGDQGMLLSVYVCVCVCMHACDVCVWCVCVGDDWILVCDGEFWNRDQPVRFKHFHTNG